MRDTRRMLDAAALCDLITLGERKMSTTTWKDYFDKHCSREEAERWKAAKLKATGGDWDRYARQRQELWRKIEQALPLEPDSATARDLLAKWSELLAPFAASLDSDMQAAAETLARKTTEGLLEPPLDRAVWDFIEAARRPSRKGNTE